MFIIAVGVCVVSSVSTASLNILTEMGFIFLDQGLLLGCDMQVRGHRFEVNPNSHLRTKVSVHGTLDSTSRPN